MISSHGPIPSQRRWGVLFILISEALDDYQKLWNVSVHLSAVCPNTSRDLRRPTFTVQQLSSCHSVSDSQLWKDKRKQVIRNVRVAVKCLLGAVHTDSDGVYGWLIYQNKIDIKIWLIQIWDQLWDARCFLNEMHYRLNLWFMAFFPPTFFI